MSSRWHGPWLLLPVVTACHAGAPRQPVERWSPAPSAVVSPPAGASEDREPEEHVVVLPPTGESLSADRAAELQAELDRRLAELASTPEERRATRMAWLFASEAQVKLSTERAASVAAAFREGRLVAGAPVCKVRPTIREVLDAHDASRLTLVASPEIADGRFVVRFEPNFRATLEGPYDPAKPARAVVSDLTVEELPSPRRQTGSRTPDCTPEWARQGYRACAGLASHGVLRAESLPTKALAGCFFEGHAIVAHSVRVSLKLDVAEDGRIVSSDVTGVELSEDTPKSPRIDDPRALDASNLKRSKDRILQCLRPLVAGFAFTCPPKAGERFERLDVSFGSSNECSTGTAMGGRR